tara:strand:+ start:1303 stop:1464 length:162 start_codon:yes stop_codon:yes gene_type:complete
VGQKQVGTGVRDAAGGGGRGRGGGQKHLLELRGALDAAERKELRLLGDVEAIA